MKIHHIRPFSTSGNIGKEYNDRINDLPDDCYIALTDGDCMYMVSDWGSHVESIIKNNQNYDIITCMTNRIGISNHCVPGMFDQDSVLSHVQKAKSLQEFWGDIVIKTHVAPGLCMIFHKSLWSKYKFKENSIIFDLEFSKDVIKGGGSIGLAKGLYMMHLYRYGKDKPKKYKAHLPCNTNTSL